MMCDLKSCCIEWRLSIFRIKVTCICLVTHFYAFVDDLNEIINIKAQCLELVANVEVSAGKILTCSGGN